MADELDNDPTLVPPERDLDVRYKWDEEYQRHIMALLLTDKQFLLQSIDLIKPSYFTNKAHQKACSVVFRFFKQYHILPQKIHLIQEIKTDLKDNKSLVYYVSEVNALYDYVQPGLDARDYLTDKIAYFAKIQAVKEAFFDSLDLIAKKPEAAETWDSIYNKMQTAMTVQQNFDLGTDYFGTYKERYVQMQQDIAAGDRFVMNFASVDNAIGYGGFSPGEVAAVVAGSGVGKSVCMTCITAANLMRGKRGLYLSCELGERKIAERMDAILTGFPIKFLCAHRDDIFKSLETVQGLAETKPGQISPFLIKKFPAGTATVNTFRAYLAQLKFRGFVPDFVVVDYVGEMRDYADMKVYESRERICRELRAMADEEKVFVLTALQPNRGSNEAQATGVIDQHHLGDSYGQIRPLDGAFALMQNDNEKAAGLARGFMMKTRDGDSRFKFYLGMDRNNLRIWEIDQDTYRRTMASHVGKTVEKVDLDHIKDMDDQILDAANDAKAAMKKRIKDKHKNEQGE